MDFNHWLQSRLTAHGYPVGPIDGILGNKTKAAIRAFQKARGLRQTGLADDATVAALRLSSTAHVDSLGRDFDPAPSNTKPMGPWPRQNDVPSFFGPVGTGQVLVDVPWAMKLAWDKRVTVRRISLHRLVADSASRAFDKILSEYGQEGIKEIGVDIFGGSLNVRRMRGGSRYSMHSWAIAIDFDPERNQLRWNRPKARLSHADCNRFWEIWEAEGWVSLGRARDFDWQHVQAARL